MQFYGNPRDIVTANSWLTCDAFIWISSFLFLSTGSYILWLVVKDWVNFQCVGGNSASQTGKSDLIFCSVILQIFELDYLDSLAIAALNGANHEFTLDCGISPNASMSIFFQILLFTFCGIIWCFNESEIVLGMINWNFVSEISQRKVIHIFHTWLRLVLWKICLFSRSLPKSLLIWEPTVS